MPTLDWIGKKAVVNHHREVPFHLLKCNDELSVVDPGSGNLLVQGDNLVALKALLPYYAGQVKCIYIDPPYNTGNEGWVYNDNVNSPEMREWLSVPRFHFRPALTVSILIFSANWIMARFWRWSTKIAATGSCLKTLKSGNSARSGKNEVMKSAFLLCRKVRIGKQYVKSQRNEQTGLPAM